MVLKLAAGVFLAASVAASVAVAQTATSFVPGAPISSSAVNSAFGTKVDGTNGTCSNCTATGSFNSAIGVSATAGAGVTCDGTADDTAALNTFLATFASGATVYVPAGRVCFINSGNLNVPNNVTIRGVGASTNPQQAYTLAGVTGFKVNPAYTISMGYGSTLQNLFIYASNLTANPSTAQAIAAVTAWGTSRSIALTIQANVAGVRLQDLTVIGFNTMLKSYSGEFTVTDIYGDCYNGIEVTGAGDQYFVTTVRMEPWYSMANPAGNGSWARPGIAYNIHDATGGVLNGLFSFMYANAVVLNTNGVLQIINSGFEWFTAYGNGLAGSDGIRMIGHNAGASISNTFLTGFTTYPFADEGYSDGAAISNLQTTGNGLASYYLAGAPATPSTITIAGTPAAGNTVATTFTSAGIVGSPLTLTYTVVAGDTAATIAQGISSLIVHSQPLVTALVSPYILSAGVVQVQWQPALAVTVSTAVTGGVTATVAAGSQTAGSSGMISGAVGTGDGTHPIFLFAPNVFSWVVSSPFTGDNILPANWISVDPTSVGRVSLQGVRWSESPTVTSCGTGAFGQGTDAAGYINVGSGTITSCTLTFNKPYPWAPRFVNVNTSVSGITAVSTFPTTTGIVITTTANIAGGKIYYQVTP